MSVEHVSNPPARRPSMPEVVSIRSKVRVPPVTQTLGTSNAGPGDQSAWSADSKQRPGARLEIPQRESGAVGEPFSDQPHGISVARGSAVASNGYGWSKPRHLLFIFRTRDSYNTQPDIAFAEGGTPNKVRHNPAPRQLAHILLWFHQGLVWITPSWRLIGIAMRLRQKNEERLRGRHHVQAQESQASHDDPVGHRCRPYSAESHSSAQLIAAKPAPFARTPQRFPTGPFQELFSRPRPLPPR